MKKTKIIFGVFLLAIVSICWQSYHEYDILSLCDSPIVGDHSGAPNETNCTACHGGSPNTGDGILEFSVGNDSTYVPGQTYNCNVKMSQAGLDKFGFVNLSLKNSGNTTIGTFNIIDPVRTRKYTLGGKNYFSHTPCGADADTIGKNEWNYSWTAPTTDVGNITLYISALAVNHNHATTGDFTYTKTIMLSPSPLAVEEILGSLESLKVYPNPASDFISVTYENLSSGKTEIKLMDLRGRTVSILYSGIENSRQISKTFSLKEMKIAPGIYWLNIARGNKQINKKLIII
jgi:hypothetical protein